MSRRGKKATGEDCGCDIADLMRDARVCMRVCVCVCVKLIDISVSR